MRALLRFPWYAYPLIIYGLWLGVTGGSLPFPHISIPDISLPRVSPDMDTENGGAFLAFMGMLAGLLTFTLIVIICRAIVKGIARLYEVVTEWSEEQKASLDRKIEARSRVAKFTPAHKVKYSSRDHMGSAHVSPETLEDARKKIRRNVFGIKEPTCAYCCLHLPECECKGKLYSDRNRSSGMVGYTYDEIIKMDTTFENRYRIMDIAITGLSLPQLYSYFGVLNRFSRVLQPDDMDNYSRWADTVQRRMVQVDKRIKELGGSDAFIAGGLPSPYAGSSPPTLNEFVGKPVMPDLRWRLLDIDINTLTAGQLDDYLNILYGYGTHIMADHIPDYSIWTGRLQNRIMRVNGKIEEMERDILRGW